MIRIDKTAPSPIYLQVKEGLKRQIFDGRFKADRALPTEHELAAELGLNRLTVRRALVELADEGLIHRVRGRGSFLSDPHQTVGSAAPARRTRTLVVIGDTERMDPQEAIFYYRIFQGVMRADPNVNVVYRRRQGNPRDFVSQLKAEDDLDGYVVLSQVDQTFLQSLMKSGRPSVLIDCAPVPKLVAADAIGYETESTSCQAVTSLIRMGHRDIAMLVHAHLSCEKQAGEPVTLARSEARVNVVAAQRLEGYRRAFLENGLRVPQELIFPVIPWTASAYAVTRSLLRGQRIPTAFFTTTDNVAIGIVAAVKDHGWQVPSQMSVIGVGDLGIFCTPALSTIRMPLESVGETAVRLLKERLDQPDLAPRQISIPTEYIARATCDLPREGGRR
jgi:DNA-binding LacI/PurR family transcriptional regulator